MKRREFIGSMAASAAMIASGRLWAEAALPAAPARLPRRSLGKSGIDLSMVGFSGIVARDSTPEAVEKAVGDSIERGVNYFDVAASYGNSEAMLAPALKPRRKEIILATKTRQRSREGAAAEFTNSCAILGTDYFDLYLVHGIQNVEKDVEPAFAPGGAMEFFLEKKKEGRIRMLGFSAHSNEAALEAMARYDFDFFYFPVNYAAFYKGGFGPAVFAKAREKGIPCIALKALARQHWPKDTPGDARPPKCWYQPIDDPAEAALAVRWAFEQNVVSILPPGNEERYRRALTLCGDLSPLKQDETERLKTLCQEMTPLFPRV